jgi:hypothetical protein
VAEVDDFGRGDLADDGLFLFHHFEIRLYALGTATTL